MKRSLLAAITITLTCLCAGCWDIKEINQLALVDMIATDLDEDNNYHVYFQILNPPSIEARGSGPTKAAAYTFKVTAPSMGSISVKALSVLPRRMYTSHLQCYVITERNARAGLKKFLNLMENYPEMRTNVFTLITEDPVSQVMNTFTVLDRIPGRNIRLLTDMHAKSYGINKLPVRMKDIIAGIPFSRPTLIPLIHYIGDGSSANSDRLEDIDATKNILKFEGGAVFVKGKMVGKVDNDTKVLYYVLNGYARRVTESFVIDGRPVVVEARNVRVKRSWSSQGVLTIKTEMTLGIINNEQDQPLTIDNLRLLEREFNVQYRDKCKAFERLGKKNNWDLLGIGDMKRGRPNWRDVQVEFNIQSTLHYLGNTITPYE